MMGAPSVILREARSLVAREGGWTQGAFGRDYRGLPLPDFEFFSDRAVCFCSSGALIAAYGGGLSGHPAELLLRTAIGGPSIMMWNDAPGRTQAEVVAAFDRAIELAEAGL